MKKKILLVAITFCTTFLLVISSLQTAAAEQDPYATQYPQQGSTVKIQIPKHNISNIEGTFKDESIKFYEIEADPEFDEPISRAEFLKLMFENYDFGEIDTSDAADFPGTINFPDVPQTNKYHEYIQKAAALNIIHGCEDGLFRPYTTITRGQIAKILVNAFNPPEILETSPTFLDIPRDHRFYEHIQTAVKAKFFQGYPDGLMRPDREINFSEAEIVIKRAAIPQEFKTLGIKKYFRAFIGIHRLSNIETKNLNLTLTNQNQETEQKIIPINVVKRDFPTVRFSLSEEKTKLFAKDDQDKTWALINGAKETTSEDQLWNNEFIKPTSGELTLGFGDKLYINGTYSGSHFGHDWANTQGTEIYAANSGKITLSTGTPSYGKTIVIDHGHNVFTMYLHFSELKVKKDQLINKGDLIGLMGSTGIATGSHLHFTQFIGSIIVDSAEWT